MIERAIPFLYLGAAVSFVLALKWLSAVPTARRGVIVGIAGMALAVGGTLLRPEIVSYRWIGAAIVAGTVIGIPMALMPMTAVPQRTALSHAFGALAAALVGTAEFYLRAPPDRPRHDGGTGSRGAAGIPHLHRLPDGVRKAPGNPSHPADHLAVPERRQPVALRPRGGFRALPDRASGGGVAVSRIFAGLSLFFGVMLVMPISGADMPTVIALLNAYVGLTAALLWASCSTPKCWWSPAPSTDPPASSSR